MANLTQEEAYRILAFAEQIKHDIKGKYDGIGLATDLLSSTADDGTTEVGGILLGISAQSKEIGWKEMKAAKGEITDRLEFLGLNWIENDPLTQQEWEKDFLGNDTGPYVEIVTSRVSEKAISKYESEYVDGKIPTEPSDVDLVRETIESDHSSDTSSKESQIDRAKIRHDLHGEGVGRAGSFVCDYCDAEIAIDEPVMYDALRVVDMANLEKLLDPPEGWVLDAARCGDCELEKIDPATEGFDEVLLMININNSNDVLSADLSNFAVVDYSLSAEGYYPPMVDLDYLVESSDLGRARWLRTEPLLRMDHIDETVVSMIHEAIERSKDVPPGIQAQLSD